MFVELHPLQDDPSTFDGGGSPVHSVTSSTYDGLGRVASRVQAGEATVADSGGSARQGTLSGGVTPGAAGLVSGDGDTAMGFDGSSGSVAAPALTALQGGASRSVELWAQTTSSGQQPLLDAGFVPAQ